MSDYEKSFVAKAYLDKLEEYTKRIAELRADKNEGSGDLRLPAYRVCGCYNDHFAYHRGSPGQFHGVCHILHLLHL